MPDVKGASSDRKVLEREKETSARRAVDEVRDGMLVGLGTGSAASYAIKEIGRRVLEESLDVTGVATSHQSEVLARSSGIPLRPMGEVARLDLVIDGVDEIDTELSAIKGGGGAMFREKVAARAADRVIALADHTKMVTSLGGVPLPVEVHPFARQFVRRSLEPWAIGVQIRTGVKRKPVLTEQHALIFDVHFRPLADLLAIDQFLDSTPGVIAHGLFLGTIDTLILGADGGTTIISR